MRWPVPFHDSWSSYIIKKQHGQIQLGTFINAIKTGGTGGRGPEHDSESQAALAGPQGRTMESRQSLRSSGVQADGLADNGHGGEATEEEEEGRKAGRKEATESVKASSHGVAASPPSRATRSLSLSSL